MNRVTFDVERPPTFQRSHVFLRIALLVVIGWIAHPIGLLWLGVPVAAAIRVSQRGGRRYVEEDGPFVTRALNWLLDLLAYLALLTDQLPGERHSVRFDVEREGSPTTGSALLRILYALPSILVLALLIVLGMIVWVVAALLVLVSERYPPGLWRFLRGIVGWEAYLLAYLASIVEAYPPFTFEQRPVRDTASSSFGREEALR